MKIRNVIGCVVLSLFGGCDGRWRDDGGSETVVNNYYGDDAMVDASTDASGGAGGDQPDRPTPSDHRDAGPEDAETDTGPQPDEGVGGTGGSGGSGGEPDAGPSPECVENQNCDDQNPSTRDSCLGILGECHHEPICGQGTEFNEETAHCEVAIPSLECRNGQHECQRFPLNGVEMVGYATCEDGHWVVDLQDPQQFCGLAELNTCIDADALNEGGCHVGPTP